MDQEKILTGYNHTVMKRLLAYAKPHTLTLVLAALALLTASLGQLSLPIIIQRGVDQHMVRTFLEINLPSDTSRLTTHLQDAADTLNQHTIKVSDRRFIDRERLQDIPGMVREEIQEHSWIGNTRFLLMESSQLETIPSSIQPYAADTEYTAFSHNHISQLPTEEIRSVRSNDIRNLADTSRIFLAILFAVLVATFLQVYLMTYIGQSIMRKMRLDLFTHTIRQKLGYLQTQPVGRLVNRITNDIETINELFTSVLITIVRDIVMMIGAISALLIVHTPLGLITLATLLPVLIITALFRQLSRKAFRTVRYWVSQINTFLSEHLSGMMIVQMFARESRTRDEFEHINDTLISASLHEMRILAIFRPIIDLLSSTSTAIMIFFGAGLFLDNMVSLGVLIAFINLIREFYRPVMELSEQFTILQSALAGGERVFDMLDTNQQIPDSGSTHPVERRGEIEFKDISFGYTSDEYVIRNFSLHLPEGTTAAIVGYTGAGKTTITKLLTRLYDINSGQILLDGTDVRNIPLDLLRRFIQPIQQDTFLFRATIAENISLGKHADGISIEQAARLTQAHDFIMKLPAEYSTVIQEGGENLSTGQRQLLSFARALYHNPRVIILDEATANIDTETERLIQTAMKSVLKGRTSIVIAHRLSTIQQADIIVVMSHGEIAESGTHDELIRQKGLYHTLYQLQYQEEILDHSDQDSS